MELDELKTLIKSKLEEGAVPHTAIELETAVRKKALSVTGKIKRSIWFELAACAVCMIVAVIIWMIYASVYIHLFCTAAWLFCIVFSIYLCLLYRKIIFYEMAPRSIKERLQQIINIITRFTRLDFQLTMGLVPVIFIFGLITGYMDVSRQGLLYQFHWSAGMLWYVIAFIISWPAIIYIFSRWHIRKLYGNYLLQLQQQLKDIENG
ncbi:MAG: hypothetical protein ABIQ88_11565 [Chitinophagaceae bacterium]